ncbi:MAG: hypothetical protein IJS09_07070, partial [Treponema sp.]|nr:hypothetical protein [Treponema sp.]
MMRNWLFLCVSLVFLFAACKSSKVTDAEGADEESVAEAQENGSEQESAESDEENAETLMEVDLPPENEANETKD